MGRQRDEPATTVELQDFKVGQHLDVHLDVDLGPLQPGDVVAELVVTHGEPGTAQETIVVPLERVAQSERERADAGAFRAYLTARQQLRRRNSFF